MKFKDPTSMPMFSFRPVHCQVSQAINVDGQEMGVVHPEIQGALLLMEISNAVLSQ